MGQFARAEPLYQQGLEIRESKLGPDHLSVANSLNNLASLYVDMGQYAKAEPLYRRSLKITETQLGADHPALAETLNNLANLYKDMGQYAQAEPLYQRSLKICSPSSGRTTPRGDEPAQPGDPLSASWANTPGPNRSTSKASRSGSPDSGRTIPTWPRSLSNLAALYKDMGQYAKAEPLFLRSIKICESEAGAEPSRRGRQPR